MIRPVLKYLLLGLLVLLCLPVILGFLLASETVNRWLFQKVMDQEPRLHLELSEGQLWRGWQFEQVVWRDEGIEVVIDQVRVAWSPDCLFKTRLCIDELDIESIHIQSKPSEDPAPERQAVTLPELNLPIDIQLERIRIGSLWLNNEQPLLTDMYLSAYSRGDQLVIQRFTGNGPDLDWQLDGDLRMTGDWPLQINAAVTLPPVDERDWSADIRLDGSLNDLEIKAFSRGYLEGILSARGNPLEAELPLMLAWQGEAFLPLQEWPETLTLNDLRLQLSGNLDSGFVLQGNAHFPGSGGRIDLDLDAQAGLSGISELVLQLSVAAAPDRRLRLAADASWEEQLLADATLDLQHFPWQWLYPQDVGAIQLEELAMTASLRDLEVSSELVARLSGVAGQTVELAMTANGNQESVRIAPFELQTEAGKASGEAVIDMGETLAWNVSLLLEKLNPGVFVAQLPGELNGPISSQGSLGDSLQMTAEWALDGSLRAQPLAVSGSLDKQTDTWLVNDLLLRQGENRIAGGLQWGEQIAAKMDINLPRLNTLWPGLAGEIKGAVNASGNPSAPVIALNLTGRRVGLEELSIAELNLQGRVSLTDSLPGELTLSTTRIRNGETRLGDLELSLGGNKAKHNLTLTLDRGIIDLRAQLTGQLSADNWQGQLNAAELAYEEMIWRLVNQAAFNYRLEPARLRMAAHCWQQQGARLCFTGEQHLLPDRRLSLALNDFALETLDGVLPEDFTWDGILNADIEFTQAVGGEPVARVDISSLNGVINVRNLDQTLAFPYESLQLNTLLEAGQANTRLLLASEGLGRLDVQARIDDPAGERNLTGEYRIEQLKLDILRPFLTQVEELRGEVGGRGSLSGTLAEPRVTGDLRLREGHVSGPTLPISLEQLSIDILVAGQRAEIDGKWRSGEQGQGSLRGAVIWAPELDLDLTLQGDALPVTVEPYAALSVSPNLNIALADNRLQVTGQIAIPEGDITVRELPEQAVRLSPDVVIVGEEMKEEQIPLDIRARVQLLIGDQLRFSGFGLTGRLSGRIEVEENMNASGNLNILDGRFNRYGQRLSLRRAQILFAGPISQPFLDIEAIRRVDYVVAGLRLTGRAEAPQSEVFSEPGMAQEQALSYLILGRPLGGDGGDNNMVGQAALALGLAGSAPIAGNIASSLGIEGFQLETEGVGVGTQVVAAGYITDKISLRYGVSVFEPANQLALRYDLTRRLYLEAVSGFASSLDFFYRIDF
ncbi:translocation/assembly module TamB domain-containing protein [Halopseudomonas pelagia]|uniref:translocation/assembly module TamB domain-containing protein n=1 Tax=Halopseudomonas pelagia TaxID=553151 RepID=UPI0003A5312D|nr:translocation/assembly module TamB domain-containing protein [Halopseudomonas pelagia]